MTNDEPEGTRRTTPDLISLDGFGRSHDRNAALPRGAPGGAAAPQPSAGGNGVRADVGVAGADDDAVRAGEGRGSDGVGADEQERAGDRPTKRQKRRRKKSGKRPDKDAVTADGEVTGRARDTDAKSRKPQPRGTRKTRGRGCDSGTPASPQRAHRGPHPEGDAPQAAQRRSKPYAALDLGTNNCRLLIAVPTRPGQFRVIDAFSRIVRLGEGLSRTGSLSGGAMDRALSALSICAQKLTARQVESRRLIATEACRQAANGPEFLEMVAERTGLELEIVDRRSEAQLAVSGCGTLIDRQARGSVLFDIGGGSTEIALLDLRGPPTRRLANRMVGWTSLPVGVVTLAERHGGREVTPAIFEAMVQDTLAEIARFPGRDRLAQLAGGERFHLLGTSGTVTTLAGVHLGLERYDRRQVDGLWLSSQEADSLVETIAGWSFAERLANPCIGRDRADLVLAGCAILQAIRRVWPAPRIRVADRGLREGLLTDMMVADGAWHRDRRRQAGR